MRALSKQLAIAALLGTSFVGLSATASSARDGYRYHDRGRVVERCDRWGHHCSYYRCDWDDCYRVRGPYPVYERRYYEPGYYGPPPPQPGVSLGVRVR